MAAPYYYLYDGTNTLNLDANMYKVNLGTPRRKYVIRKYAGSHGGKVQGTGLYEPRQIKVETRFSNVGGNNTWDSNRSDLWAWINRAKQDNLWFYIKHNDDSTITRVRCYPTPSGSEIYSFINVSERFGIRFVCDVPYFEKTTATTGSETVTDSSQNTFTITNGGDLETSCKFKFTPTADETSFQVELASNFGFTLEKVSFLAGQQIIYDTGNGQLTIAGSEYNPVQILTSGGVFNLAPGSNSVYVTCSGAGTFAYEFSERYI
jgi:hypothetical protein